MSSTRIKQNEKGESYLDLDEILAGTGLDVDEIGYYTLTKEETTKKLVITLYDKQKKLLKVKTNG